MLLGAFMTLFFIIFLSFGAFHAAASRAEAGAGVAADSQEALFMVTGSEHEAYPSGRGKDLEDFLANVRNKKLQRQKRHEPRSVLEGSSANGSSLLEDMEDAPAVTCPTPAETFPGLFDKQSMRLLGQGGFGHAYAVQIKGCAATRERDLVVKTMEDDPNYFAWVEVLLAESFKDAEPGLVTSFAHARATMKGNSRQKCMFMLMEHADSGELFPRLRRGELSLREKALIFYESLVGLRTLHKRGIVHRDIKSRNIFLLGEDVVKDGEFMGRKLHPLIGDYGLVCCSNAYGCGEDELQPGVWGHIKIPECAEESAGTLGYMSPRIANGEKARPEDDLWSMGKVLLQIIHGTQGIVYTIPELAAPLHKDPQTYVSNLASSIGSHDTLPIMTKFVMNQKGGRPLRELAEYLLCNGCEWEDAPQGHSELRDEMTSHAITLAAKWLKELKIEPGVLSELGRPKLKEIEKCVKRPFTRTGPAGSAWSFKRFFCQGDFCI